MNTKPMILGFAHAVTTAVNCGHGWYQLHMYEPVSAPINQALDNMARSEREDFFTFLDLMGDSQ